LICRIVSGVKIEVRVSRCQRIRIARQESTFGRIDSPCPVVVQSSLRVQAPACEYVRIGETAHPALRDNGEGRETRRWEEPWGVESRLLPVGVKQIPFDDVSAIVREGIDRIERVLIVE